ncbi:MAG: DegV family protein [Lachnospiraceae bacterium]|nr:DegV family protein [Lachnospiraceae bacterium]
MLRIFTDTDTDITPEVAKEFGYNLISMPYSYDGNTVFPYEDFDTFESKKFYDMLRSGVIPTTSAISKEKYIGYFKPVFEAGDDILYVHFSRAMTATFEGMDEAVAELKAQFPERKFYAVDTKAITIGALSLVYEVGDLYKAGKSAEEIVSWVEKERDHFAIYFFADDLKFFKRSGRVSGIAATMGNMIGIRPIIYISDEGKMVNIGKERGRENALKRLVSYAKELGDDIKGHRVIIAHADAPELASLLEAKLREEFGDLNIITVVANPTVGSHCGPDSVGVSFHAIHR